MLVKSFKWGACSVSFLALAQYASCERFKKSKEKAKRELAMATEIYKSPQTVSNSAISSLNHELILIERKERACLCRKTDEFYRNMQRFLTNSD